MKERQLQFGNEQAVLCKITINKTIVDYAYEYQQQIKITTKQL